MNIVIIMMISDCDNDKDNETRSIDVFVIVWVSTTDNRSLIVDADCSLLSESDNGERQQINLISIICTGN